MSRTVSASVMPGRTLGQTGSSRLALSAITAQRRAMARVLSQASGRSAKSVRMAAAVLAEEGVTAARTSAAWLGGAGAGSTPAAPAATTRRCGCARGDLVVVDEAGSRVHRPTWSRSSAAARPPGRSCCWSATRASSPRSGPAARWPTSPSAASRYELAEVRRFTEEWERAGVAAAARRRPGRARRVRQARPAASTPAPPSRPRRPPPAPGWPTPSPGASAADGRHQRRRRPGLRRAARRAGRARPRRRARRRAGPRRLGGRRRRGRGPGPGPPQRLGPRRLRRQHRAPRSTARPTASPPLRPDGGLTVAPIVDARRGRRGGRRSWASRSRCPPPTSRPLTLGLRRRPCTPPRAAPSTPATACSAPGTDLAGLLVPMTRGREANTAYVVTPRSPTTPRPGRPLDVRAAHRRGGARRRHRDRPSEELYRAGRAGARRGRGPLDHDPRRPADRVVAEQRHRRPHRPPRWTGSPPTGRLTRARARRAGRRRRARGRWSGCCAPPSWPATTPTPSSPTAVSAPRPATAPASLAQVLHHRISKTPRRPAHPARRPSAADLIPRDVPDSHRGVARTPAPRPPTSAAHELGAQTAEQRARVGASRPSARSPTRRRRRPRRSGSSAPGGPPPSASWPATTDDARPARRRPAARAGREGRRCSAPRTRPSACSTSAPRKPA